MPSGLHAVRDRLVNQGLILIAICAPFAIAATWVRTQAVGWQPAFTVQLVCAGTIILAAVFRRHLPHPVKAAILLGGVTLAGLGGLYAYGLFASGMGLFFTAATLATIFFGTRAGLSVVAVIAALIAVLGAFVRTGVHRYSSDVAAFGVSSGAWLMTIVLFLVFAPVCVFAVGAVYQHMQASLARLRKSEAQYRTLFDNSQDAFMTLAPPDWRFRTANPAMVAMFGAKEVQELTARGPADLSADVQPDGRPSADAAKGYIAEAMERGSAYFEWRHRRLDGTEFPATVLLTRLDLGGERLLQATVRDVTEQKRREESLRRSEERLRDIFENANDIIISVDPGGRVEFANPRFFEILSYSPEETEHLTVFDLLHPESRTFGESVFARLLGGEAVENVELSVLTKDGARLIAEGNLTCHFENGVPAAVRGIFRDVTKSRGLEEQLRQAQKMEAVGQLAGGVAHDFNNLLQAITGYGQIAQEELRDHPAQRELDEVLKAASRATTLVRQLLAFSRRQVLELRELDMNEIVGDMANMIRRVIGEHIDFTFHAKPGLRRVVADKGQIEQILMNLCVNARDAMPEGGALTVELANTELSEEFCRTNDWARPGRYVMLAVTDSGCGMDAETRKRIFEPFFTTKDTGKGTGLGLSTALGIVEQHNGRVHVYSEPGVGTTFRIYLPMVDAGTGPAAFDSPAAPARGGSETILLAEDDDAVRELAVRFLKRAGYTVHAAVNGAEAIRRFDELAGAIDLAILDVVMPVMNGTAVADYLNRDGRPVPVLFASGYSTEAVHTNFVLKPGVHLIQKPYHFDELLAKIRDLLDGPREPDRA